MLLKIRQFLKCGKRARNNNFLVISKYQNCKLSQHSLTTADKIWRLGKTSILPVFLNVDSRFISRSTVSSSSYVTIMTTCRQVNRSYLCSQCAKIFSMISSHYTIHHRLAVLCSCLNTYRHRAFSVAARWPGTLFLTLSGIQWAA